ncbi:BatD family protein [Aegicerativicinus sediminis]|uniref:BatD family protein n=1 Tax=Aegicerativicinus sediminis TaxID=2893202 RepID=UPI001E41D50C|nr:BatD family protein [Aegicerativicinus sediminis]
MKTFVVSILFLSIQLTLAQVNFEAKVSKTTLGENERLRVDFNMNAEGDNFIPPSFNDFTVLGGPNRSVQYQWINGKRSYNMTYTFFLAPKAQGTFKIGSASVEVKGDTFKSNPVTITVTKPIDKPKDPNDPNYIATQNLHLVAEVSKTNPYLNEAITVVYKLYVSTDTGVEQWREIDNPRYNDFWSQNIKIQQMRPVNTKFNGEDYRYVVLRKVVLYPQKSGKLEIEPLSLDVTMKVPTNQRSIFGDRVMARVNRTVSAGSKTINVKALPEKGKPMDFSGAVGKFDFSVTTSKDQLDAAEAFQAKVEVTGNGNLKLIELPKLTLPSSLEVYEPEHTESIKTDLDGMKGTIADNYTIIPQYKGKYPIPGISFSYFDPKTESYKRINSDEIVIDVLDGPINSKTASTGVISPNSSKQEVIVNNDQFAYIKTDTELVPIEQDNYFKSVGFWSSLLFPLIAIPLVMFVKRRKDERDLDVVGMRRRQADRMARRYLSEAKKHLGNKEMFYVSLEKALHNYLKARLRLETSELSKDRISSLLKSKGVDQKTVLEFVQLLKNCELARYTPITQVEMKRDYDSAATTIASIDKEIK